MVPLCYLGLPFACVLSALLCSCGSLCYVRSLFCVSLSSYYSMFVVSLLVFLIILWVFSTLIFCAPGLIASLTGLSRGGPPVFCAVGFALGAVLSMPALATVFRVSACPFFRLH